MKLYLTYGLEDIPEGFEKAEITSSIEENSIDEFIGHHCLDKMENLDRFFYLLHKGLKPEGKATFHQTYFRSSMAWMSPLTIRGISEHSLAWLSKEWREVNKWSALDISCDFEIKYALSTDPDLDSRSDNAKAFAIANYSASISGVQFVITKK